METIDEKLSGRTIRLAEVLQPRSTPSSLTRTPGFHLDIIVERPALRDH